MSTFVNLFGGPCTGKSTVAAWLCSELKKRGYTAEIIHDAAKDIAYRGAVNELRNPLAILSAQYDKELAFENNGVDFIICEAPSVTIEAYNALAEGYVTHEVRHAITNLACVARRSQTANNKVLDVRMQACLPFTAVGCLSDEQSANDLHIRLTELVEAINDRLDDDLSANKFITTSCKAPTNIVTALVEIGVLPLDTKEDEWFAK